MVAPRRKKLLVVGAGLEQIQAIDQVRDLGLSAVACDGNHAAPGLKQADIGIAADIRNVDVLTRLAREHAVDGIFCHAVEIPEVVARVASRLNLPGLRPEVADRATYKNQRLAHFQLHGIPCARFELVEDAETLADKASRIGLPLVLKPADNAGARGVRVVDSMEELAPAYRNALSFSRSQNILLEELMRGPEISTESVVYRGEIHTFAFADRNYARPAFFHPYFIEDGINFPSALPQFQKEAVCALVERAIRTLEIDFGAAKGDVILDRGVPKVIEMAARTSGGWFGAGSIRFATGANMLKPLIQMAVGDEPDLNALKPTRSLGCAQRYVMSAEEGVFAGVDGVQAAREMPGVEMCQMFLPPLGTRIRRPTHHSERYGQIICTAPTREEAISRCEAAVAKIRIRLQSKD